MTKPSASYRAAAKLATAPVRLAIACRLIHRALTGPRARKKERVEASLLHEAWEALERCWEEFEAIRWGGTTTSNVNEEELIRFADGWVRTLTQICADYNRKYSCLKRKTSFESPSSTGFHTYRLLLGRRLSQIRRSQTIATIGKLTLTFTICLR